MISESKNLKHCSQETAVGTDMNGARRIKTNLTEVLLGNYVLTIR